MLKSYLEVKMEKKSVTKKGNIKVRVGDIEKALKQTKAKREKKTIRLYVLFVILILLFVVLKYWESSQKQEIIQMARDMTPALRADETSANIEPGDDDMSNEIIDEGTRCQDHKYILSSGTSEQLKFEIKLKKEVVQLAHLLKHNIQEEDISIESSFDKWVIQGITADIEYINLKVLSGKTNVWTVNAKELFVDLKKAGQPAVDTTAGGFDRISGYVAKKTHYLINFFDEESGVISMLGRYYDSEAKVGELLEQDITAKLGGVLALTYVREGKNYQLPVENKEVEKVAYFVNFNININLPDKVSKDFINIESNFVVKIKEAADMKFVLKLSSNTEDNEFQITGPAIAAECYKPAETQ
jgi:hypothetical protein